MELAEFTLRPDLCAPEMSAEKLMMIDFAEGWTPLGDLGVAVMPTTGSHASAWRCPPAVTTGLPPLDRIRAALKALPSGVPPAFDGTAARPRTIEPKRRWWKRHG
ncbi:hypothetical protein PV379_45080 [Streptomyces caniscabiei]|uniref:hypothetical protein n=1 Tax=Streptomyces caniscabiei TaxID=2746961 RepID=UPI0029B441F0|nr:hypothetical protein [Streptomyces caniscabiei]MDX2605959.1 hypothetical protein [Streptomyces caniscabiei]MDX2735342.1 hypothetical protein [Streptomyces caniscabiei]MDX2784433.1 hypothetical protein [Streptomyces caniscabiei]